MSQLNRQWTPQVNIPHVEWAHKSDRGHNTLRVYAKKIASTIQWDNDYFVIGFPTQFPPRNKQLITLSEPFGSVHGM